MKNLIKPDDRSLFDSMCQFVNRYVRKTTPETLLLDIPMKEGESLPAMFDMVGKKQIIEVIAAKCGLKIKFIRKGVAEINKDASPFILFLKDNSSVIVESIDSENLAAKVVTADGAVSEEPIASLAERSYDLILLAKKEMVFAETLRNAGKNQWFFEAVWMSSRIYMDVLFASLFINVFAVVTPLFTMNVYDRIVPNDATESLWALSIGVLAVFVFDSILKYLRHHFLEISAKKTEMMLSGKLFGKVMDYRLADRPKMIGSFASNIKDFDMIRNFLSSSTLTVFADLPFMIIFFIFIAYIGGLLFLVPLTISIILLIYALTVRKPLQNLIDDSYVIASRRNGLLIESLKCLETIKSFNYQKYKLWEWDSMVAKSAELSQSVKGYSYSLNTFFGLMVNLNTVVTIIAGCYLIADKSLTTGGLVACVMLSSRALSPVGQMMSLITTYDQAKVAYKGVDDIMQKSSEVEGKPDLLSISSIKGKITFKNVSFRYAEDGPAALNNVSFTIQPGEKVALLGKIGSGKSTIQKLIMGFYNPADGEVSIDDLSVAQINPMSLRGGVAYVPQKVDIFRGTLRQNITVRRTDADDDSVLHALDIANLKAMVNSHPKGVAGEVDEDGNNLSGGQKQSVAIARAFIAPSSLALLDEPTESIDFNTESIIIDNLKRELKNSTLLLVTHKNSLLSLVDRVIVMDEGRVVYDGDKDKMFKKFER